MSYSSEVSPKESLFDSRPECDGNDEQLLRIPHVPERKKIRCPLEKSP
jgi:hypothetical protein